MSPTDREVQYQIWFDIAAKAELALRPSLYGTQVFPSDHPRFLDNFMTYAKGVGDGAGFRRHGKTKGYAGEFLNDIIK